MAMRPGAGGTGSGSFVFPLATGIGPSQGLMPMQQQSARFPMVPVMQPNVQNMMAVGYNPQISQAAMAMQGGLTMGPMQPTAMTFVGQAGFIRMAPPGPAYTPDMQKQFVEEQQKRFEQQQKMLEEERKRRQFEEQKQKLRLLSSVKPKTAEKCRDDAMEAIRGNLDGFSRDAKMHPPPVLHALKPVNVTMFPKPDAIEPMLPSWIYNDSLVPDLYRSILESTLSTSGIDTTKLYPILLSSGLPRETLGQIWAMANKTTPGKLTKEELYIVLAMIGITQQRGDCTKNMDVLSQFTSAPIPTLSSFPATFPSSVDQLHVTPSRPSVTKPLEVSQPTVTMKSTSTAISGAAQHTMPSSFTQPLFKTDDDDFQDFQDASKSGSIDDSFSDFQSNSAKSTSSYSSAPTPLIPVSGTAANTSTVTDKYAVFKTLSVKSNMGANSNFTGDGFTDFKSGPDDGFTDFKTADSISPLDTPLRETQSSLTFPTGPQQKSPILIKPPSDLDSFSSAVTNNSFPKTFHLAKPVPLPVAPLTLPSPSPLFPSSSFVTASSKSSSLLDDFGDFTLFGPSTSSTSVAGQNDFADFMTSNTSSVEQNRDDKYNVFKLETSTAEQTPPAAVLQTVQPTSSTSFNKYELFDQLSLESSLTFDETKDSTKVPKNNDFTFQYDKFTTSDNAEKTFVDKFVALKQAKEDSLSIKSLDLPSIGGSSFGKDDSEDALSIQFDMKLSDMGGELKHVMSDSSLDLPTVSGQHPPAADDFKGSNENNCSLLSSLTISDWSEKDNVHAIQKQPDFFFSPDHGAGSTTALFAKKETSFGSTENLTMTTISKVTTFSNDMQASEESLPDVSSRGRDKANDDTLRGLNISSLGHSIDTITISDHIIAAELRSNDDFGEFQSEKPKISKIDFLLATSQGKVKSSEEMIKTELETLDLCAQGSHKRSHSLGDKEINRIMPSMEPPFRDRSHTVTEKPSLPVIRDKYKDLTGEVEESERYAYEWQRCLESALQVIKKANDALNGISSSSVCTEVIQSAHGMEYLLGVIEVYRVTKRVELGIKSTAVCSEKLQFLLKDIDKLWNNLIGFMSLASLMPDESALDFASCMLRPGIKNAQELACGVCLLNVDSRSKAFNSETDHFKLSYGGHQYHASCANFWINCVEPKPPGLLLPDLL
ncbi:synergin gamma isoform 2-T2 [Anomaloglossus baeobatrachus]|uniref:synergin gamma isoform X2 n=1 Tax=Anomaloglossus baeobatrachus TaxID=238106 RepID=UPI003F507FFD